jgi:hypothetical protein
LVRQQKARPSVFLISHQVLVTVNRFSLRGNRG